MVLSVTDVRTFTILIFVYHAASEFMVLQERNRLSLLSMSIKCFHLGRSVATQEIREHKAERCTGVFLQTGWLV